MFISMVGEWKEIWVDGRDNVHPERPDRPGQGGIVRDKENTAQDMVTTGS